MDMTTIDITKILSSELQSRIRVHDLLQYIVNSQSANVTVDFKNVQFATRSFMDEFYNVFLKNPSANAFKFKVTNLPSDISAMLESVSKTQTGGKTIQATSNVTVFKSISEAKRFLNTLAF